MNNSTRTAVPEAHSPADITACTVALDGGTAIVEHAGDRVEVTIRLSGRTVLGIALTPHEANMLGMALARPDGPTIDDLFSVAGAFNVSAADMIRTNGPATV